MPSKLTTLTAEDFAAPKSLSVPDALLQRVPSVYINDTAVNPFQPDVSYRGFVASPTAGVPQGLAVYQNGVRVNESFGDIVNWDFIPEYAIKRLDVLPNNPIFGLNALGGAISIEMKNGFNYQGREVELLAGSYWRRSVIGQVGMREGNKSFYVAADALNDNGWRDRSPSELRRIYADVGILGDRSEFHVNFTGASNFFGAAAATPIELLRRSWSAVYTTPQTTKNQLAFLNSTGSYQVSDTLSLKGNVYYRGFWQKHVDGNTSDVLPCDGELPGFLCFDEDDDPLFSLTRPCAGHSQRRDAGIARSHQDGGERLRRLAAGDAAPRSYSATATTSPIGASVDRGHVRFGASSELGIIRPDLVVIGTGFIIAQPDGTVAPADLKTTNTYFGWYVTDTFDVTSRLSVTAGGRFNLAQIKLEDQLGTALNGSHQFMRFNPVVGATYKFAPEFNAYAGYSEANRAPTPLELACADPVRPCIIDAFLVSDPPLKQVVARTYEAGLRGTIGLGPKNGSVTWNLGVFHTTSEDDILQVASSITGRGFFQNVGSTLRRGIEASATYRSDRWNAYASYNYIRATFEDVFTLNSPGNPFAVDGVITVTPGNVIPSIPAHRFKAGAEYAVFDNWKVGADLIAVSRQYLRGDETNLNPMLPGYWLVNLNTTYKVSKHVELFGLVRNLFDRRYFTFGTFFETAEIPFLGLTDSRTLSPGAPLSVYAGVRAKF